MTALVETKHPAHFAIVFVWSTGDKTNDLIGFRVREVQLK
jgi:hypothetical protein